MRNGREKNFSKICLKKFDTERRARALHRYYGIATRRACQRRRSSQQQHCRQSARTAAAAATTAATTDADGAVCTGVGQNISILDCIDIYS